jgi:hypothetical protein
MTTDPTPEPARPDFTSPIAGRIEVREPCPWCPDRPMVPRSQMDEHVARLHPDVQTVEVASAGLVAVPPTTALRDRIAEAVQHGPTWTLPRSLAEEIADAVLGVLPAGAEDTTTTQAAVAVCVCGHCEVVARELRRLAAETQPEFTESVIYEVVGNWGVDSADSETDARAAVAKWLKAYPTCGAYAQQRIYRDWPDGSEWYGPWTVLPDHPAAAPAAVQTDEEA